MESQLAPFAEISAFESLDAAARLTLSPLLAAALGREFRPMPKLVGTKQMVAVEHVPSGVELVAIPGGRFDMGFTERDLEEVERCIDCASEEVTKWLKIIVDMASPVHAVTVAPFLLSRATLRPAQVQAVGGPRTDDISVHFVEALTRQLKDFRLPSEAELEYVAREGGAVSFMCQPGQLWATARAWPDESAWGFADLFSAAWAADEWHPNYVGAPSTSAPWTTGGPPGVYRGCLMEVPRVDSEVIYALAAWRARMSKDKPEDDWPVGVRIARSIGV
jgi:formylglycine-generating enzyme required for sulfatase activity